MRCGAKNNCINNKKNKWFQLGNLSIVHSYRVNANCNFNGININIGYYYNIAISKVFSWLKVHQYKTMVFFLCKCLIFFSMKLANWRQNGCDVILLCNVVFVKNNRFTIMFLWLDICYFLDFPWQSLCACISFFLNIFEHHKIRI